MRIAVSLELKWRRAFDYALCPPSLNDSLLECLITWEFYRHQKERSRPLRHSHKVESLPPRRAQRYAICDSIKSDYADLI
jgi:hypothetical protein